MQNNEKAYFGGGCFWCTEAIFQQIKGVVSVISGYAGGIIVEPDYETVSMGKTGHAEVIQITFDPKIIPYDILLDVFFHTHDPTTVNQQGNDFGTQYRSLILYTTDAQKNAAEATIKQLTKEKEFTRTIVTEVKKFSTFYKAESYHADYYNKNQNQPYCQVVISPKLQKLREKYTKLLTVL